VSSTATIVVVVVEADRIEQRADDGNLSAHSKLVSALASALTESTITASKMALSDALTLAIIKNVERRREGEPLPLDRA
jgi:Tfp pilus assembly PilM family ATPase